MTGCRGEGDEIRVGLLAQVRPADDDDGFGRLSVAPGDEGGIGSGPVGAELGGGGPGFVGRQAAGEIGIVDRWLSVGSSP